MDCCEPTDGRKHFRSYQEALNLSEQDIITVAAPNAQPAGNRPGPKSPNTHAPHEAGLPATGADNTTKLTPGHTKGVKTAPTGGNKNVLR